ncbi:hypothetical protein B0H34DRAFT_654233 [Crassisporium funariophilum]|nr:hypothetical protein B0H34DRAFT_654233 [Crassisporium funariophilum]
MFDRLLLVTCICIVVALTLYFFYWNRFIAFIIGQILRILWWNQGASSIWVEIGSIHFSLVAGRILLKDFRYHSSNQTMKIIKVQIQWRYWIRRPTSEEEIHSIRGEEAKHSGRLSSCRVQISFQGAEWFLYSRTAAYDNIISQMEKATRPTSRSSTPRRFFSRFARQELVETTSPSYPPSAGRRPSPVTNFIQKALSQLRRQLPSLDPKDLLPLGIDVQTGAIILGNPSTPSLLVAEFTHAVGTYGIIPSRSQYDLYKQILDFKFQNALVRFVQNEDYVDPMTTLGSLVHSRIKQHSALRDPSFYQPYRTFIRVWRQLRLYGLTRDYLATRRAQRHAQKSVKTRIPTFKRSKKAVDDETLIGIDFSTYEYAVERNILEAPSLEVSYYVDAVGEVPSHPTTTHSAGDGIHDINNGDTAPEWGFDLIISGGFIRYGPWADRQRAEIQRLFFPPTYQDSELQPSLRPGDKRVWSALQVFVELRDETTLHIPFREASKDWQWDGQADIPSRPRNRESASINIAVGDRSSINYIMPMVAGPSGYESILEVHLDSITTTSSLNDIRLVQAESCRVRGELPSPLRWNDERTWSFAVSLRQPILFLLRDHINMFTDLGKDWASGPPTDYQKFIPMIYAVKFEMHHFEMNLYANDQNIIDKPLVKDENALLTLRGPHFMTTATIPSNTFRPESTCIPFAIVAPDLLVDFSLPRWNTHALHAPKKGINLFKTKLLNLEGSYLYFAEAREEHVEQLKLDIDFREAVFKAFGWSIRYFMVFRDNYLGSFTHFQTLYEYLEKRRQNTPVGDPIMSKYRPGKANMLQAEISLSVKGGTIMLPIGLMGHALASSVERQRFSHGDPFDCFTLTVPEIQLQFRMHDYFMEMSLNMDALRGTLRNDHPAKLATLEAGTPMHQEILMIDGIDITANRLFGPPPRTATYVCIWEIAVGHVKASMSAAEAKSFAAAGSSFGINFVDSVNAPADAYMPGIDLDVTFYKVTVKAVDATWRAGNAALVLQLSQGLKLDSNDLGAHHYRRVTSLRVPQISTKVLLTASIGRNAWLEAAEISLDAYLDIYSAPQGHRLITRAQLAFIEEQDKLTGRAKRMFNQLRQKSKLNRGTDPFVHKNGVYLPQPSLPSLTSRPPRIIPTRQGRQPKARSQSWRFSTLADLSDSEDDEGVSEADRDARLVKTRTSTPVPQSRNEDGTTSSGDESDNADLTEGDSSGDEWSDAGGSADVQATGSLLSFYSPLTKHYTANRLGMPGTWEGASFNLTRAQVPFSFHDTYAEDTVDFDEPVPFPLLEEVAKDADNTTFRLKCCKSFNVALTPLVLPAAVYFEEDVRNVRVDPEMCIDTMLAKAIGKVSAKDTLKCVIFDVNLPRMNIQILQHVAMSDEGHPNVYKAMKPSNIPSSLDITAVVDIDIKGVRVIGSTGGKPVSLKASLEGVALVFDMSIDKRTLNSNLPNSVIFELDLSNLGIELSRRDLSTTLGGFLVKIGHRGPELITATSIALVTSGTQIIHIVQRLESHLCVATANTIYNILKASDQLAVIDPLSTIQPSYLVQTGIPHLLRTEITFKFLYHLRNCVWNIGESERKLFDSCNNINKDKITVDQLVSLAESRLGLLDQDAFSAGDLTTLEDLFSQSKLDNPQEANKSSKSSIDAFSLLLGKLTMIVLAPAGGSSSEFFVNNFHLNMRSRSFDLVQFTSSNPSSASQTSLRAKSPRRIHKMIVSISLSEITLIVLPHLMHFAQHILRVKRQFTSGLQDAVRTRTNREFSDRASGSSSKLSSFEIMVGIHRLRVQAAAENLVLVVGVQGVKTSSSLLLSPSQTQQSMHHTILFDEVFFQARSPSDPIKESEQDILAALAFLTGQLSVVSRPDAGSRQNLKLVFTLTGLRLHVPRSALRLYRFVQEWRADYLPGMEAAMNTLLSEYKGPNHKSPPTASRQVVRHPILQIHAQINHFEIALQVMHGTWLSWEVNKTVAYVHSPNGGLAGSALAFGLQIASMTINVSSKPNAQEVTLSPRVKLVLPPLSLAGHSDEYQVHALLLVEFIELKVKPSHWDTLLAVQQKFGQDFNDLVALMQETRSKGNPTHQTRVPKRQISFQYGGHMKMRGFRIGLEGISSTVYLECQDINGSIKDAKGWTWDIGLSDLALSLAPRTRGRQHTPFNRNHRSAFVIIDFKVSATGKEALGEKTLGITVTKIHAVMQPSSIGEVGDFIDNLQAEMLQRQEQRAFEMAAFKEKTQSILRTFDVNVGDIQLEKPSWVNDFIINIWVQSIGVAFPLTHDEELELPHNKGKNYTAVRAFLFSIKSIEFGTHRGETGNAVMQCLSFQFVPQFRQSSPQDFAAEKHQTRNRLVYPEMKAQLKSSSSGTSRKFWIGANVSGFVLDLDSNIPNYVFSLIDVYRQGKERVERLSANVPRTPLTAIPVMETVKPSLEKHYTAIPTSNVFANLTFLSGKVRLYSGPAGNVYKTRTLASSTFLEPSDEQVLDLGAEVFNLPELSVWAEYRATPASQKLNKTNERKPSILMFKSTVHSSKNTLTPTLLPFLTELVNHVETRMRKVSSRLLPPPSISLSIPASGSLPQREDAEQSVSSMQICFSLRIDRSTLELTCQPDVNVVAGLHWESGGFVVNVSPGARKVSFSGSVGGLTVGLKHGFLSEDCVKLNARNLGFSVTFNKTETGSSDTINSVSVVLDTEFLGAVRFSRLQDILCFKAVWLDRIPIFNNSSPVETKTPLQPTFQSPVSVQSKQGFSTVVLVRIRRIKLDVDLGQSITSINLELQQSVFRTKLTQDVKEVYLFVKDVSVTAKGNISGHAQVPSCVFQTIRRSEGGLSDDSGRSRMLELRLTSGALVAVLESDLQKLLYYRAEPLEVEIFDDWSMTTTNTDDNSRPIQLSFTVMSPEVVAVATVGTIPKLLSYMNKFKANMDAQRQGAFRESQTFRVTRTPKPENPLSAVAEAMIYSARSRFKEAGAGFSYTIRQHMSLRLNLLQLVLFPRTMDDVEIAQFVGRDVRARLDRLVGSDSSPAQRDLQLSFSSMAISKHSQVNHPRPVPPGVLNGVDGREWLASLFKEATEAIIVGLPSMNMHMTSEEAFEHPSTNLVYDFHSQFVRREGMEAFEDIYITLNMSLYSWLTVLRKNLTREMDQVRATEVWRTSMSSVSSAAVPSGSQRKKIPEPLTLTDSPRSATLPSAGTFTLSPYGPSSARFPWMDQNKSATSAREYLSPLSASAVSPVQFPSGKETTEEVLSSQGNPKKSGIIYKPRIRQIERLTMRQLGEATPDVMHPFFMKKAGFNLEDSLPQYVHEYANGPLEEIMEVLLKLYSRQLLAGTRVSQESDSDPL